MNNFIIRLQNKFGKRVRRDYNKFQNLDESQNQAENAESLKEYHRNEISSTKDIASKVL